MLYLETLSKAKSMANTEVQIHLSSGPVWYSRKTLFEPNSFKKKSVYLLNAIGISCPFVNKDTNSAKLVAITADYSIYLFGVVALLSARLSASQLQLQGLRKRHAQCDYHWLGAWTNLHFTKPIGWFDHQLKIKNKSRALVESVSAAAE